MRFRRLFVQQLETRTLLTAEIEPNDSFATATLFTSPADTLAGEITSLTDVDTFRVALTQGQALVVDVCSECVLEFNEPSRFGPQVEVFDNDTLTLRAQSADGRGVVYTAHADDTYLVRLTSNHALGDFVGAYQVATVVHSFSGLRESEPNDTPAQAHALGINVSLAGAFSSAADADHFSFRANAGETVAIDFGNDPAHAPALRLHAPSGQLIAENATGLGVYAQLPETGTYVLEVYVAPDTAASLDGYVATCLWDKAETQENESSDDFEHASIWEVTSLYTDAFGSLSSVTDVDVFAIDFDPLAYYSFSIVAPHIDQPQQSRRLSLYNEHGQFLQASTTGSLETWDWVGMPSSSSKHFLVIEADGTSGLGAYDLGGRVVAYFSEERDVPLFVHDYTAQGIASGARWNSPFDRPDAIGLLIGLFDSQYDVYDVDVAQALPPDASEYVSLSLGDLDNGAFGGGGYGIRRADGFAYCPATGSDWDEFADLSRWVAVCIPHELGHGVGMRHARDPLELMGYANQADGFSVDSHFIQAGGDSRTPFPKVQNTREYLDWALQAGYYVRDEAGNDAVTTPQDLDPSLAVMSSDADPRNDRVVVLGRIETAAERDYFSFTATAGERIAFDVDAAEFQYPLNAQLTLYDAQGTPFVSNTDARDWDTGLDSVDPLLRYVFTNGGRYVLEVSSEFMTVGDYRLKVTPDRALDGAGPRVIGALPDGNATVDSTRQLVFWFDSQLDPDTLTEVNILVEGSATGLHPGLAAFDPLDSTLIWQANDPLPPDTYTVRIVSGAVGVKDLKGNALDGETGGILSFPSVSGDGQPGGDFVTRFTVSASDTTPVAISSATYERHPYNRGMFELSLTDDLDILRTYSGGIVARAPGRDGLLDTADDFVVPLDVHYPKAAPYGNQLFLYTRGIPDSASRIPDAQVGTTPWFLAAADLDADNTPDLAVANFVGRSVSVLLGNGDGTFQARADYATGSKADYVAVGDFNEDDVPDLVVANNGANNLSVLLGHGDGSFQSFGDYSVGNGTSSVAVADFDRDTHLDLAVTGILSGDVSILRGSGAGTFVSERSYPIGVGASRLAAADFNKDSRIDLAIANVNGGWVRLLLGNGDGTFTAQGNVLVGANPEDLGAGDLNGDGKPDLAVVNRNSGTLTVRLGNGDGTFQAATTYSVQNRPVAVQLADINADSQPDVVVANRDSASVSILLGVGDGTFHPAFHLPVVAAPRHLAVVDINDNGNRDLAIASETGNVLGFLLGGGDGTFHTSGYRLEGTLWDAAGQEIALSQTVNVAPDPVLRHGPSVIDLNVWPGAAVSNPPHEIEVRFSGALDPATLTTASFLLRYSPTPDVFGARSSLVAEADGQLNWDATSLAVKFEPATTLANGYYLLEIDGDVGGVADTRGELLDGEYLDAGIVGNTTFSVWEGTPSGDGIPGGDYRAYFVVAQPALEVALEVAAISELDGSSVATVRRTNVQDLSEPVTVTLTSSDETEAIVPGQVTILANQSSATFAITAVDDDLPDGTQTVTITAAAAGYIPATATVDVTDVNTLQVTGLAATASGFVAQFNRDLDCSVLNLYDGVGGTLGAPDAILQDGAGQIIAGSLVVDGGLRAIAFVRTDGLLEPDTYTVTLFSGATRFREPTGGTLDGNADGTTGDDYQITFTVAARPTGTVAASVPDFARGAAQPVNIPNTTTGLPIRLDHADGVTSLAVDLVYDQDLLEITAATLAAGLPADWSVVNPPDTGTPGVARIRASGTTPLSGTNLDVVRLTAEVPNTAPYGASQAIRLENVVINGGATAAIGDVAVHKAAYLGDADGSGIHSSADAFLTVQAALGLAGGFAAHAWTDPRIVGDADGSRVLSAADAFLIVQEGLGLVEPFVPDHPHIGLTHVGGGVDPQFQIGVNLPASSGGLVTVPVQLDVDSAATNVGGLDFDVCFDASRLTIQVPDGVSAGADTAGRWALSSTLVTAGHLRVGLVSSRGQSLAPGLQEIAQLQFHVAASLPDAIPLAERVGYDNAIPVSERPDHVVALDIEPLDPRAGGYTWTAVDGSIAVAAPNAAANPWTDNVQDRLFGDVETELSPLATVLTDLMSDIACAWR